MIRGNWDAIELGLELAADALPGRRKSVKTLAVFCELARQELGLPARITHQDLWFLEQRALRKLRVASQCRTFAEFQEAITAKQSWYAGNSGGGAGGSEARRIESAV
jgi:hypothetical protein